MPTQFLNPPGLFPSLAYGFSHVVTTTGRLSIHVSGQTAWTDDRTLVGGTDLAAQAQQSLRNLRVALQAAGADLGDVVSLRIYVVNYKPANGAVIAAALNEFFPGPQKPASTWIGVAALANPDFLIEVEALAVKD
jgi:enamine deaminase RidA (YjgF/YER057c/UK114 family)